MEQPEEDKDKAPEAPVAAPAPEPVKAPVAPDAVAAVVAVGAPPAPDPFAAMKALWKEERDIRAKTEDDLLLTRAERDKLRQFYERAGAEANRLRDQVQILDRERRESLAESRLKERDALRDEVAGLARKVSALEKELAESRAKGEKLLGNVKGMSNEIERTRETARIMQQAREAAYRDRDLARAAQREAEERAGKLAEDLKGEREARAEEKKAAAEAEKARKAPKPVVKEGAKA